jgi:hypothetical protein
VRQQGPDGLHQRLEQQEPCSTRASPKTIKELRQDISSLYFLFFKDGNWKHILFYSFLFYADFCVLSHHSQLHSHLKILNNLSADTHREPYLEKLYCIQHCFIYHLSDSTVSEDAGIEPRTVATSAVAIRRSNH